MTANFQYESHRLVEMCITAVYRNFGFSLTTLKIEDICICSFEKKRAHRTKMEHTIAIRFRGLYLQATEKVLHK